jgi:hypothetical protein
MPYKVEFSQYINPTFADTISWNMHTVPQEIIDIAAANRANGNIISEQFTIDPTNPLKLDGVIVYIDKVAADGIHAAYEAVPNNRIPGFLIGPFTGTEI